MIPTEIIGAVVTIIQPILLALVAHIVRVAREIRADIKEHERALTAIQTWRDEHVRTCDARDTHNLQSHIQLWAAIDRVRYPHEPRL